MVQETLLRKHLVIITTFDMVVIMSLLSLRVIKRQGTTNAPTQSVTVFMYKDAINNKISEIETELAQANQNDYSVRLGTTYKQHLQTQKLLKMKLMQPQ